MSNKKFRVEIGINLNAAPVPLTNPNLRIFPLQNALIDITDGEAAAVPAWYSRLGTGDEISFRLVDTSNRGVGDSGGSGGAEYPQLVLTEFLIKDPKTGQAKNPFTEEVVDWRLTAPVDDCPSPVYSLSDENLPAWDFVGYNRDGEQLSSMKFAECGEGETFRAFELTVIIRMLSGGWVNQYVFDPEMIISETDSEGGKDG